MGGTDVVRGYGGTEYIPTLDELETIIKAS